MTKRSKLMGYLVTLGGTAAVLSSGYLLAANARDNAGLGEALQSGELAALVQQVEARYSGKVVEIERERDGYDIELIDDQGKERDIRARAGTEAGSYRFEEDKD